VGFVRPDHAAVSWKAAGRLETSGATVPPEAPTAVQVAWTRGELFVSRPCWHRAGTGGAGETGGAADTGGAIAPWRTVAARTAMTATAAMAVRRMGNARSEFIKTPDVSAPSLTSDSQRRSATREIRRPRA
jgi:hypothetical protein